MRLPSGKCLTWLKVAPTAEYYISWDAGDAYIRELNEEGEWVSTTYSADSSPFTEKFSQLKIGGEFAVGSATNVVVKNSDPDVISMYETFFQCNSLESVDITELNTSNVSSFRYTFAYCPKLTSINLSNLNTSNALTMGDMFTNCRGLSTLDLSNFNTSKVIDMSQMFLNCTRFTSLDVSNFDTSSVQSMRAMFYGMTNITVHNLNNFNTTNVKDMSYMFCNDTYLGDALDLSNFNTDSVVYSNSKPVIFVPGYELTSLGMQQMFYYCVNLGTLDLSNFNMDNLPQSGYSKMFYNCISLRTVYVDNCSDTTINKLLDALNTTDSPCYGPGSFALGTRDGRKALIKD